MLNGSQNSLRSLLKEAIQKELEVASERVVTAIEIEVLQLFGDSSTQERSSSRNSDGTSRKKLSPRSDFSIDPPQPTNATLKALEAPRTAMARLTSLDLDDDSTFSGVSSEKPRVWARRSNAVETALESRRRRQKCKSVLPSLRDQAQYNPISEFERAVPLADPFVNCDPSCDPSAAALTAMRGTEDRARMLTQSPNRDEEPSFQGLQELQSQPSKKRAEGCCSEQWFDKAAGVLILLNAVLLSVETDWMARNWCDEMPLYFDMMDFLFCILFSIELGARIWMRGCEFFYMKGWEWNIFDFLVVSIQIMETAVMLSKYFGIASFDLNSSTGTLRIMRVARLFRTLRLVRAVHLIRELHTIFKAIVKAIRSLAWTIVLLMLMMFIVGVSLTQMVTDHKLNAAVVDHDSDLEHFYGTLGRSVMSLYMMISQGLQWRDASNPLADNISYAPVVILLFYITFTIFGLTNIVTSVFVESVIQAREESGRDALLHHVNAAFNPDQEADGSVITLPEFERHMADAEMLAYLKAIDLSPNDASELFKLLDTSSTGKIPLEDFLSGCMRLQGTAKALDLAILTWEHREQARRAEQTMESLSGHLMQIHGMMQKNNQKTL